MTLRRVSVSLFLMGARQAEMTCALGLPAVSEKERGRIERGCMRSREREEGKEEHQQYSLLSLPPPSLLFSLTHSLSPTLLPSLLPFLPLSFPPSLFLSLPLHLSSCLTHALIFRSMGVSFLQQKRYLYHTSHLADWRVSGEGKKEQHYHSGLVLGHSY